LKKKINSLKNKYIDIENSSNLHNKIKEILCNGSFKNVQAYQEVPISYLIESNVNLYIDWYIPMFKLCIEVHGIQHYVPTSFSNTSAVQKELNFYEIKSRDLNKKSLLEEHGYNFIEISYKDINKLDENKLISLIDQNIKE